MEFRRVVRRRRMVRNFDSRPIPDEVLQVILDHATRAPSAGFAQGWGFLVLRGPVETGRFWEVMLPASKRGAFPWPGLLEAPVLIIPLANESVYRGRYALPDKAQNHPDVGLWTTPYWFVDTAFASMLILLTATDEGLGALFFAIADLEAFRRTFGVPDAYHPIGAIALGYALPDRPSRSLQRGRRPASEVFHFGNW